MFSFTARGHNRCAETKMHIFKLLKGYRAITHLLHCWAGCYVQLGSISQIKLQMGNPRWPIFLGVGSGCLQMFPPMEFQSNYWAWIFTEHSALCACRCHRFHGRAGVNTGHQEMQRAREEGNEFSFAYVSMCCRFLLHSENGLLRLIKGMYWKLA